MPTIYFRADASVSIGYGHVMRCLTLADSLKRSDISVSFICIDHNGHLGDLVKSKGYFTHFLNSNNIKNQTDDLYSTQQLFHQLDETVDLLVVDHYQLDVAWEKAMRRSVKSIMVIDDLANRKHDCDFLLDQNFYLKKNRYQGLVPQSCKLFLGTNYTLLREEFLSSRNKALPRKSSIHNILISFGGTDPQNLSLLALKAINKINDMKLQINIVTGSSNPHLAELVGHVKSNRNTTLHIDTREVAKLMTDADLCIGAGGSSSWERLCLGLPSLIVTLADNQIETTLDQESEGLIKYIGHYDDISQDSITQALILHINSPYNINKNLMTFVDGLGASRISQEILEAVK